MAKINLYLDLMDLSELKTFCLVKGRERLYAKDDVFLAEGEVPGEFGFVESGYFKFALKSTSGSEKIIGFSFADDYIGHINNSLLGLPSEVSQIAGCTARAHVISMDEFVEFASDKGLRYCAAIQAVLFHTFFTRYTDLYRLSPIERYEQVLRRWPDVLQQVPLRELASYLGVTPIHLSRLRRSLHSR